MDFPMTGYVVSINHLDTFIDIRTQVCTDDHRYCAALLLGQTNYNIHIGDILSWTDQREVYWYPASEEIEESQDAWKIVPRKLWLVRVLSQESYPV